MNTFFRISVMFCLSVLLMVPVIAQDAPAFGFGDPEASEDTEFSGNAVAGNTGTASPVSLSGEFSAQGILFNDSITATGKRESYDIGSLFSGVLNLSVTGSRADGVLSVEAVPDENVPFVVDEAYARVYLGKADLEAGLRKLTWGRADSQGPLDVINPQDQSDLTVLDELERKIARPLVRLSYSLAPMTRIEAVYLPSFEGDQFASDGRWVPGMMTELAESMLVVAGMYGIPPGNISSSDIDTSGLGYSQAGVRFTTTLGSVDFGAQYFYGYLKRPSVRINIVPATSLTVETFHNPYHQIGLDCATVLAGFNLRAELGANITDDLSGDKSDVYNPSVVWSLGFDRDVVAGINLNLQGSGSVRLMDNNVGSENFDFEDGTDVTKTRITAIISKKLYRDQIELKTTAITGIEDRDYYIIPAVSWTRDDVVFEFSAGFFGGRETGELGCYDDNDYLKGSVTLSF